MVCKAGVMMLDLIPYNEIQRNLLDKRDREALQRLMETLDDVNHQYGSGALRYAAEGMEKRWKMREELGKTCKLYGYIKRRMCLVMAT
jgi:DNA polymerase V